MAVIYSGTLANLLGGYKGMSIESGQSAEIDAAVTFSRPFLNTPAVFVTPTSDKFVYAASSAVSGFTPTACSATSSGAGTTCDWVAIGRGDNCPAVKHNSASFGGFVKGAGTKDTAAAINFENTPTVLLSSISDWGCFATVAKTSITPEDCTGDSGAGTTCNYLALGQSYRNTVHDGSVGGSQLDALWVEIGTYAALGAVTFAYPFLEIPKIFVCATSDDVHQSESDATTGFTVDDIALTGAGDGISGVYMAIGAKRL